MAEDVKDPNEQHEKQIIAGHDPRLANIKEGSNKEPPQYTPYKITVSK